MSHDRVGRVAAVRLQADYQIEETLVRVRFAFLAHIIGRRLVKVQSTDGDFGHLILLQLEPIVSVTKTNKHERPSCRLVRPSCFVVIDIARLSIPPNPVLIRPFLLGSVGQHRV